jgi:hypothetical protein
MAKPDGRGHGHTIRRTASLRKRALTLACVLAAVMPAVARGQADSGFAEVRGTVYDSVAGRALAGAEVQLASQNNDQPFSGSARTDSSGAWVIRRVPPGRYLLGFQHRALDTLALTSPVRAVTLVAGRSERADLAVPSGRTIIRAVCGPTATDSSAAVIGILRDARTGLAMDSGFALASWDLITIERGRGMRRSRVAAQSMVNEGGWFTLCRIPSGLDVVLSGFSGSDSSGSRLITLHPGQLARRDIALGGTALIRGVMLAEGGAPIRNGRVNIGGREQIVQTDTTGHFVIGEVRAGTQTLEARAIGYGPAQMAIDLRAGQDTSVVVTLLTLRHMLDTMKVIAERVYDRDSEGFEHRRRAGGGFFFTADQVRREHPYDIFSILNQAPTVTVRYGNGFEKSLVMRAFASAGMCTPTVWIDGKHLNGEFAGQLDFLVQNEEIAGIEVYETGRVPGQFLLAFGDECGAIVIWTQPITRVRPASNP